MVQALEEILYPAKGIMRDIFPFSNGRVVGDDRSRSRHHRQSTASTPVISEMMGRTITTIRTAGMGFLCVNSIAACSYRRQHCWCCCMVLMLGD